MRKLVSAAVGAIATLAITASAASALEITGAGSSFVFPILSKWASTYKGVSGDGLNYQSIGSGGGIAQIKAKTVTFGATDKPLSSKELAAAGLTQFPVVIGGIVPVVNVPGVKPGQLTLDGATIALIFQGKVTRWDDAAIKKLNPSVALPSKAIAVVHRSDGSGTTYQFSSYLSRISNDWKNNVGADTAIDWPVGIGAKGNEGVAGNVAQVSGSIGYVEYAYAKQNHLSYVKMINKAGQTVEPTVDTFKTAASSADWGSAAKNDFVILFLDQPGPTAWPITATTFALVYKQPGDQAATAAALKFFKWGFQNGGPAAVSLDYVPLPDNAVQVIEASWKGIQGSGM
ncbi:MAG: phosphate ABC transporter substrate-binding protein PstS [Alphaproteobacteria bacterium]|nr:phosphate ABC transporter substrate-binding protein PstS [Alphaproteobacteria bacterium]